MARVLVTGSTQGLGRAAAVALLQDGHRVVVHARNAERARSLADLGGQMVVGDLASRSQTLDVADQVNALGRMDAVIHNAGVYREHGRSPNEEGHPRTLAVNALAPYLLTALLPRPDRLVYLSSGMHRWGDPALRDPDWTQRRWDGTQAYSDSKLIVTALALALAARWPDTVSSAVDPGWVPTRMGGPGAPDDLDEGHRTQVWLATSDADEARASGGYWHHLRRQPPAPAAADSQFQERVMAMLERLTGQALP